MLMRPALLMICVWVACSALYFVLPFELIHRTISIAGVAILLLFITVFCIGAVLCEFGRRRKHLTPYTVNFKIADWALHTASAISIIALAINLQGNYYQDLALAYQSRSDAAAALLHGQASTSGIPFQIGFLTYPVGYIVIARQIIFSAKIRIFQLLFFGALPIGMANLSMGGRFPLLYLIFITLLSLYSRRELIKKNIIASRYKFKAYQKIIFATLGILTLCSALYYFAAVFSARANSAGGTEAMFYVAEDIWGIGFKGKGSEFLFSIFGRHLSYLIFVFSWYITQGAIMATTIFSDYEGPLQLGIYGIDLVSAITRRIDGDLVASNFNSLIDINTYGFFPSAFGSLYIDFSYFGLVICLAWGAVAGTAYNKIKNRSDPRWHLVAPFITTGILFSQINTPLGFTNGFVTHLWLALTFLCIHVTRRTHVA